MNKIESPYKQFASFSGLQGAADAAGKAFMGPSEDDAPESWSLSTLVSYAPVACGLGVTALSLIWWIA